MLSCKESTHLISEAQDRSLSLAEKVSLETHMLICAGCRRYREQMSFLHTLCQQHPVHPNANPDNSDPKPAARSPRP